MSWLVIGDREYAAFAGDTSMTAFGPLHYAGSGRNAKEELTEFGESLERDPRNYGERELRELYAEWLQNGKESEDSDENLIKLTGSSVNFI